MGGGCGDGVSRAGRDGSVVLLRHSSHVWPGVCAQPGARQTHSTTQTMRTQARPVIRDLSGSFRRTEPAGAKGGTIAIPSVGIKSRMQRTESEKQEAESATQRCFRF